MCLYDPNNFYYCRSHNLYTFSLAVYTTQTISTIVDVLFVLSSNWVYTTQTISTIVDIHSLITYGLRSIRPKQFLLL